jgi:hypothetical protein
MELGVPRIEMSYSIDAPFVIFDFDFNWELNHTQFWGQKHTENACHLLKANSWVN